MAVSLTWDGPGGLKLRHLRLLVAIDLTQNMHAAAESLMISQPAASRLLSEIERIVGVAIFVRHSKGLTPNVYGEVLIRRANFILSEIKHASEEVAQIKSGLGGVVSVGALTSPAVGVVVDAVLAFQQSNPLVRVDFEHDISPPLIRGLLDGRLDFVLSRLPADISSENLEYVTVDSEEFVLLVRDRHPLLAEDVRSLQDTMAYPWILQSPGTLLRQRFDAELHARGLKPPRSVVNTSSVLFALALLSKSDSIAVVSSQVAELFTSAGQFKRISHLEDEPRLVFEPFSLVRHRYRDLSPSAQVLHDLILDLAGKRSAASRISDTNQPE